MIFKLSFPEVTASGRRTGEGGWLELESDFETELLDLKIQHRKNDPRLVIATGVRLTREEAISLGTELVKWGKR